ncbi:MAG: hypothetical protein ACR2KP_12070 [Egibacteraceae bacterium]
MDIAQTLTELETAVRDVEAAEAALAEGKQRLHRTALRALVAAEVETDLQQLVSRLYWEVPALPVRSIGAAVAEARQREYAEQDRRARAEEDQRAWYAHLWDEHPELQAAAIDAGLPPWSCGCDLAS